MSLLRIYIHAHADSILSGQHAAVSGTQRGNDRESIAVSLVSPPLEPSQLCTYVCDSRATSHDATQLRRITRSIISATFRNTCRKVDLHLLVLWRVLRSVGQQCWSLYLVVLTDGLCVRAPDSIRSGSHTALTFGQHHRLDGLQTTDIVASRTLNGGRGGCGRLSRPA